MRTFYNIVFSCFFWLSAPYYFLKMLRRGNWREGFMQRFGRFDSRIKHALTNRHSIWFHAVSVGEVNVCTQIIQVLEQKAPNLRIVVSTTTTTGMAELKRKLPSHIIKIYYPVDFRRSVRKAMSVIHPEAVVLVEAEIWPNFIWHAHHRRIPIFLVNARLSEKSYKRYKMFKWFFSDLFRLFTGVGAQNEKDAKRLIELGCNPNAIRIIGNLKFDAARLDERKTIDVPTIFKQVGFPSESLILVAGSTHQGEEEIIADIFKRLKLKHKNLFLVLVPRHQERGKYVGKVLQNKNIKFIYRTEITAGTKLQERSIDCILVNTTGELKYFYEYATVTFIGKSLTATGGQNPIEPGALGKCIVFGPNMQNFEQIAYAFLSNNAAIQVKDAVELEKAIDDLLSNPEKRELLGKNAIKVVEQNLGAVERTVEMILEHLNQSEIYVKQD